MRLKKSKTIPGTRATAAGQQPHRSSATGETVPPFPIPPPPREWLAAFIAAVTFLAFLPVVKNGFVQWDDATLLENLGYRGLGLSQLQWIVAGFHLGHYQPLVWLTYAFDHSLWWMDPFGYHLTSLLFHVGNAVLVYHLALRLMAFARPVETAAHAKSLALAGAATALTFAVHPMRVEAVAWASARAEVLSTLFVLASALFYLRAHEVAGARKRSVPWMRLSVAAYAFSLLAGPYGIMLPAILLIWDIYPLRRATSWPSPVGSNARTLYAEKIPFLFVATVFCGLIVAARMSAPDAADPHAVRGLDWTFSQLAAPAFYLWKTILPFNLAPAYELSGSALASLIVASMLICTAMVVLRRSWPMLAVIGFCYLVLLLPIFRAPLHQPGLADRYAYLAALPWAFLAGVAVSKFPERAKLNRFAGRGASAAALLILSGLGALTWQKISGWQDTETLWNMAAAESPSSRAYFELAALAETRGKHDEAIGLYRKVVEIDNRRWDVHERAGALLQSRGRIAEAVEHFRRALQENPNAVGARENLAVGLVTLGQIDEAVHHFREVLQLAPERNENRVKLGTILAVQGRTAEAADVLRAAAKLEPDNGRISLRLGQALAAEGKLNEAVQYFRDAARLLREDADAHESLGRALAELGQREEAARHLRAALKILRSTPAAR